jgi:hypothetical protein
MAQSDARAAVIWRSRGWARARRKRQPQLIAEVRPGAVHSLRGGGIAAERQSGSMARKSSNVQMPPAAQAAGQESHRGRSRRRCVRRATEAMELKVWGSRASK